jgi:aspartyl-tRNA(Asn)/glutamyl-tRNA(Gln) amidotransferase subunit A
MDEYAPAGIARSAFGGQTCNPYDTTRIPGGSSGGSAAAVAANLAMCALGTDTSGLGALSVIVLQPGRSGCNPRAGEP